METRNDEQNTQHTVTGPSGKVYYPVIGLEIHAELKTNSKMFCACRNNPDEEKHNTNICAVCMGHPGTLPVLNKSAISAPIDTPTRSTCFIAALLSTGRVPGCPIHTAQIFAFCFSSS
ncbi:MAG: aspartyl-tRNA(Asn)/glutamyl-tRNA(Gln) amidotransferase subunit, partial [Patescibacteria group bacterium]|nr:aspartyl-tRNA(Asn)/glutamyl-tRNA(Gln) amidotransferase subunit [Patescibacteria group bacterium]